MLYEKFGRVNHDAQIGDVIDWVDGAGFQRLGEVTIAEKEGVWVKRLDMPDLYLSYQHLTAEPSPAVYHWRPKHDERSRL